MPLLGVWDEDDAVVLGAVKGGPCFSPLIDVEVGTEFGMKALDEEGVAVGKMSRGPKTPLDVG